MWLKVISRERRGEGRIRQTLYSTVERGRESKSQGA